jgi:hypothetical protein
MTRENPMTETDSLERQTVIYNLIDTLRDEDNWCGETHVQKTTYFLEELTGHALGYPFILYKHSPYCFELSEIYRLWALFALSKMRLLTTPTVLA